MTSKDKKLLVSLQRFQANYKEDFSSNNLCLKHPCCIWRQKMYLTTRYCPGCSQDLRPFSDCWNDCGYHRHSHCNCQFPCDWNCQPSCDCHRPCRPPCHHPICPPRCDCRPHSSPLCGCNQFCGSDNILYFAIGYLIADRKCERC